MKKKWSGSLWTIAALAVGIIGNYISNKQLEETVAEEVTKQLNSRNETEEA